MIDRVIRAINDEQSLTDKWITQLEQELSSTLQQVEVLRETLKTARAENDWHKVMRDAIIKANEKLTEKGK